MCHAFSSIKGEENFQFDITSFSHLQGINHLFESEMQSDFSDECTCEGDVSCDLRRKGMRGKCSKALSCQDRPSISTENVSYSEDVQVAAEKPEAVLESPASPDESCAEEDSPIIETFIVHGVTKAVLESPASPDESCAEEEMSPIIKAVIVGGTLYAVNDTPQPVETFPAKVMEEIVPPGSPSPRLEERYDCVDTPLSTQQSTEEEKETCDCGGDCTLESQ